MILVFVKKFVWPHVRGVRRFWPFSVFSSIRGHWEKMLLRNIVNFLNFLKLVLALLPHWQHPGSLWSHPDIIQTPTDTLQTPRNSPLFWSKMGHWKKMQYVEIKIPTRLFSIVLALIYSRQSPEGPENTTGGVGGAHGGRRDHHDGHQDGHQEHV